MYIDYNIPGQDTTDTGTNMNGTYVFDELALYTVTNDLLDPKMYRTKKCKQKNRDIYFKNKKSVCGLIRKKRCLYNRLFR